MALLPIGPFYHCPLEVFLHCTRSLSEVDAARVLMTCQLFQTYHYSVEQQRRTEFREALHARLAPVEGFLGRVKTHLDASFEAMIYLMTLATGSYYRTQVDHILAQQGSRIVEACQNDDERRVAYHFLKSVPARSISGCQSVDRDLILTSVFSLLLGDENYPKALEFAEAIGLSELKCRLIREVHVQCVDFCLRRGEPEKVESLLFKNSTDLGLMEIFAQQYIASKKIDELNALIPHFTKGIGDLFLIYVLKVCINSDRWGEVHRIVSSKGYLERGILGQLARHIHLNRDQRFLRWTFMQLARAGRLEQVIELINKHSLERDISVMVEKDMRPEDYAQAKLWSHKIEDIWARKAFIRALDEVMK